MTKQKLALSFYRNDALHVAEHLLGKVLVSCSGDVLTSGRIVEAEAYRGEDDAACHASAGRTPRTEVMYHPGGCAYVYLIYGMYYLFNVVTGAKVHPEAVLIRAIEPLEGLSAMKSRRLLVEEELRLTNGPGKLCLALGITKADNGISLAGDRLYIEDRGPLRSGEIVERSPRRNVDSAGPARLYPWRWYIKDHPCLSPP